MLLLLLLLPLLCLVCPSAAAAAFSFNPGFWFLLTLPRFCLSSRSDTVRYGTVRCPMGMGRDGDRAREMEGDN
ncbi:uncharacterized protein K452DRAFT_284573 [Aplosporella prunicola CBS 121167]|uniref:Secreted peptide n=1 Tax=Aplosporella prunicola CBS 121167 TaxID=1176127 RepID=A0A6A6BPL8_9PEZI|nr:uncharacterized protein K452DRAFT_284573 [Aplosporella prunicola CBS 121167]KAF2145184.1 hypothetical protein K452DRAFT_284573 [Aplosporella prunicola CBS 121167]